MLIILFFTFITIILKMPSNTKLGGIISTEGFKNNWKLNEDSQLCPLSEHKECSRKKTYLYGIYGRYFKKVVEILSRE